MGWDAQGRGPLGWGGVGGLGAGRSGLTPGNPGGSNICSIPHICSVPHICSPGLCLAAVQRAALGRGGGGGGGGRLGCKASPDLCPRPFCRAPEHQRCRLDPGSEAGECKGPRDPAGPPHPPTQGCCGAKGACLGLARGCPSSPGACTQLHTQAHTCAHTWPALLLPALTDTDIPVQAPSRCMHTRARSCTSTQLVHAHTCTLPCKRTTSACTHMCTCPSLQGQSWCAHTCSCASMQLVHAHTLTHSCVSTQASTCIHMHTHTPCANT